MIDLNKRKKKSVAEVVFIVAMLALPILHFCIFYIYINFDSFFLAFQRPIAPGSDKYYFTLANFEFVLKEFTGGGIQMWMALRNTLLYFTVAELMFPLALIMTYFIYKKVWGYKVFRVLFYLPTIITASATASMFKIIISGTGPLSMLYDAIGKPMPFFLKDSKYAIWTLIFYTNFFGIGGNLVMLGGTMSKVDVNVLEAGKIDGVTQWQELWKLIIPMIWPTIATILTLSFTGIFTAGGPILLFTKGEYNTMSISYWIFNQVQFNGEINTSAAVGLVFSVLSVPIVFGLRSFLDKRFKEV